MVQQRREIPPNSQFRHWRVLHESPLGDKRHRWFECECDCGHVKPVRMDELMYGKSNGCIQCSKKYDHLYKQVPGCKRDIADSHAWECWQNMHNLFRDRGIPVCDEWKDFEPFLEFYLQATGLSLSDVLRGRYERSFYHAERINKEIGWTPENTSFVKFVTERARHKPTYNYWHQLRLRKILDDSLLDYKEFVNIFGTKLSGFTLARHDILKPHSKLNSYWTKRNVRREC